MRGMQFVIPPAMYKLFKENGVDMRGFIESKPIKYQPPNP